MHLGHTYPPQTTQNLGTDCAANRQCIQRRKHAIEPFRENTKCNKPSTCCEQPTQTLDEACFKHKGARTLASRRCGYCGDITWMITPTSCVLMRSWFHGSQQQENRVLLATAFTEIEDYRMRLHDWNTVAMFLSAEIVKLDEISGATESETNIHLKEL
ncbi:hypothetical protein CC78DRAFT_579110 [Lojkania enalia]|uniref:Uncharacterized protein n=1 Tax=Lojkania enalia TaxID=147567 RepID=A0A9P4KBI1_9PLEO|nr:hypothetical protein CC78DRAFT_579110 [Didymosphaeria enalia]